MKAAFVKRRNRIRIDDIPLPEMGDNGILIKIDACGLCGSDYIDAYAWANDWKRFGHEIVAHVVDVGPGVSGVRPGDQIAVALSVPCGECSACTSGNVRRCTRMHIAHQGGFAEYLSVPNEHLLFKIYPELPDHFHNKIESIPYPFEKGYLTDQPRIPKALPRVD